MIWESLAEPKHQTFRLRFLSVPPSTEDTP
jgi:hypothetical protein